MLIDNVTLVIKAGDGGDGAATFRRDAMTAHGGPDGGNGGNGGDVSFQGSPNVNDLREFRYKKQLKRKMAAMARNIMDSEEMRNTSSSLCPWALVLQMSIQATV